MFRIYKALAYLGDSEAMYIYASLIENGDAPNSN